MARVITYRAPVWLAAAVLFSVPSFQSACAQGPVVAEAQQPMWVGQTPVFQVGPDGAVNLDQPMMMPGTPYSAAQFPAGAYPGQPMMVAPGTSPYAAQPWGAQAVQPQPAWGAPWLSNPDAIIGGPIPPSFVHRTSVFGEFLFIRPRDAEVAYALPIDGPVAPVLGNEVPVGPTVVVDPDYDIAFRAGFNLALNQGASLAAQYTRLRSDTADARTVTAPTVLRSLVSHPLGANAATDTLDAAAMLDINLDQIDVDFRSLWFGCECNCAYAISYLVGAQYAMLDQELRSSFVTINTTTVNTDVQFDGVGMRFGLQGERLFPASGVFVYGSGITNVLFGEFDASYVQTHSLNGIEAFTTWNAGRIVPVLDLEFGAGWWGVNRHLRLSAGYRVSTWFNVVKTEDWVWAVQNHDFRNLDGTLTFDGLVGRAEWLF